MRKRAATRGTEWQPIELDALFEHYPMGGCAGVHAVLPHRTLASIKNTAERYGVSFEGRGKARTEEAPAVVVPRMEPYEARACVEFNNAFAALNGLVNREQPMRWKVAA